MHETSATILTILAVAVTAILNRMDAKQLGAKIDALAARLDGRVDTQGARLDTLQSRMDTRFDALHADIMAIRERLARIEERIGIKAAAS